MAAADKMQQNPSSHHSDFQKRKNDLPISIKIFGISHFSLGNRVLLSWRLKDLQVFLAFTFWVFVKEAITEAMGAQRMYIKQWKKRKVLLFQLMHNSFFFHERNHFPILLLLTSIVSTTTLHFKNTAQIHFQNLNHNIKN